MKLLIYNVRAWLFILFSLTVVTYIYLCNSWTLFEKDENSYFQYFIHEISFNCFLFKIPKSTLQWNNKQPFLLLALQKKLLKTESVGECKVLFRFLVAFLSQLVSSIERLAENSRSKNFPAERSNRHYNSLQWSEAKFSKHSEHISAWWGWGGRDGGLW